MNMKIRVLKKIGLFILPFLLAVELTACKGQEQDVSQDSGSESEVKDDEATGNNQSIIATYNIYLDVPVRLSEDVLENHEISLYLDGKAIHDFLNSDYYTELLENIEEGPHEVVLFFDDSAVVESTYSFDLSEDSTLYFSVDYQGDLLVNAYELFPGIADSAISYPDMIGTSLDEALTKLEDLHFVNVHYESNDQSDILDSADWIVEDQSIASGDKIDKAEQIMLSCRKAYFQLYFDLDFDQNLLLARYDVELYLDGEYLDTLPHGEYYTKLLKVKEGDHCATFYKSTDNSVKSEKRFDISTDSTLTGRIHTNKNDIELNDFVVKKGIENASLDVVQVTGMPLDDAMTTLGAIGFINIKSEPSGEIWDNSNWIVISQSVAAGTEIDKNGEIILSCVKKVDYLTSAYLNLDIMAAADKAADMNNEICYVDYVQNRYMDNKVSSMTDEEKKKWIVKQASFETDGSIRLSLVYTGYVEMPDVRRNTLTKATEMLKKSGFSAVEAVADDSSSIYNTSDWRVSEQSVDPGKKVNANGRITLTVTRVEAPTANNSSGNSANTQNNEEYKKVESKLNTYIGKEVPELLSQLKEMGYSGTYTFETTGMDYTYLINEVEPGDDGYHADDFIVRSIDNLNVNRKTVEVIINSKTKMAEDAAANSTVEKLSKKLDPIYAWQALELYGKEQYPYGFKLHYLTDKYAETAKDENTWFLKASCDVKNAYGQKVRMVCEALVTGTNDNPVISSFSVY